MATPLELAQKVGYNSIEEYKRALNPTPATPVQQSAPASPINRSITQPATSSAELYLDTFQAPESVTQIANRKRKESQGLIDSVKELYASEFQQVEQRRSERLSEQNAGSVLSGTAGSGRAFAARDGVNVASDKERQQLVAKKTAELQGIYSKISSEASSEALTQKANAINQAEGIVKRDGEKQAKAKENLKLMVQGGAEFEAFRDNPNNKQVYDYALRTFDGNEAALKSFFALNRPQEQVVERKFEGNQLLQIYENPLTGKTRIETVNLSDFGYEIPRGYENAIDLGGQIMLVPKDFDPSKDTPFYISKSLTPDQNADNTRIAANAAAKGGGGTTGIAGANTPSQLTDATGKPIKLTAGQVDTVSGFENTLGSADRALAILNSGVQTGPIAWTKLQAAKMVNKGNPQQMQLEQMLGKLKADFMKALSGAAVSESEVKRLSKFLPDMNDQETVIQSKLNTLKQETASAHGNFLRTLGATQTVTEAPQGDTIRVRLSDGRTGTVDATEFDANSMTKL